MGAKFRVWDEFLPVILADALLVWFEEVEWERTKNSLYEYDKLVLGHRPVPAACRQIKQKDFVLSLRSVCDEIAEAPLSGVYRLMAQRLTLGHGMGMHTDGEHPGVILNIYVNRVWARDFGGQLLFFSSSAVNDIEQVIEPTHNRAVAMKVNPTAYHAVADVSGGVRYALSYFFPLR